MSVYLIVSDFIERQGKFRQKLQSNLGGSIFNLYTEKE